MKKRKSQRVILQNSNHLRYDEVDIDVYIVENRGLYEYQIFKGNTSKLYNTGFSKQIEKVESIINNLIRVTATDLDNKKTSKENQKKRLQNLRLNLVPGVILRTSYIYNMTFNHFYKVKSVNKNIYTLEVLNTEWVSDNKGLYGDVKVGSSTDELIEGKLTSKGLKVDRLYAHIITKDETFYENHLD